MARTVERICLTPFQSPMASNKAVYWLQLFSPSCSLPRSFLHSPPHILALTSATDVMSCCLIWDVWRPNPRSLKPLLLNQTCKNLPAAVNSCKSLWSDHKSAEDGGFAAACTRTCPSTAENQDRGHKTQQRGVLPIPGEHSDFNLPHSWTKKCSTDWLRQVLPSAGCGHEYGESEVLQYAPNCRFTRQLLSFPSLWLWDLNARKKAAESILSVSPPMPSQGHEHFPGKKKSPTLWQRCCAEPTF